MKSKKSDRKCVPKAMAWKENPIAEESLAFGCCHHWVIQPADGPLSEGACQNCGEVRTFTNYVERHAWSNQGDPTPSTSQVRDKRSRSEGQAEDETAEAS